MCYGLSFETTVRFHQPAGVAVVTKIVVIKEPEGERVPFLRGILVHSLLSERLPFKADANIPHIDTVTRYLATQQPDSMWTLWKIQPPIQSLKSP